MFGCPPLVLWVQESLPACATLGRPVAACGSLWQQPVAACAAGLDAPLEEFARRHRGLEAGGRLAWLAG